jgi:hypothetical protein
MKIDKINTRIEIIIRGSSIDLNWQKKETMNLKINQYIDYTIWWKDRKINEENEKAQMYHHVH